MIEKIFQKKYSFKIKKENGKKYIFDFIRKKFVLLTPEEFARQNVIKFLVYEKNYSPNLIKIETSFKINNLRKRADILVFNNKGEAVLLVECKAPYLKLTKKVIEQIAIYNLKLNVKELLISNGIVHYFCKMKNEK